MSRNIYKGIPQGSIRNGYPVCNKCGAEFEMRTRKIGEKCNGTLGYKAPFTVCTGTLVEKKV
jgi:hypothetical protein